eukprot:s1676_g6.t1
MAPKKAADGSTPPLPGFGVEEGAEVSYDDPQWRLLQIPHRSILEVALHHSSLGLGEEGWFAILVDQVVGGVDEGLKITGAVLGCESVPHLPEIIGMMDEGAVHLCPADPCPSIDIHCIHATRVRVWSLDRFNAEYITPEGKGLLKKANAAVKRAAKAVLDAAAKAASRRKPALRPPRSGDEEGEQDEEDGAAAPGQPHTALRALLQKTKERILGGDQAGTRRARSGEDAIPGSRRGGSDSAQASSQLVTGTALNPLQQTPLGVVSAGALNDSGTRQLVKTLTSRSGAASTLLAQAVQVTAQEAKERREKRRKKDKSDSVQQLVDLLRGKGRKESRRRRSRSRSQRRGRQAVKPDPEDPHDSSSDDSSGSSSRSPRRRRDLSDSDSELSCEPPLRKRAIKAPGSVMEMLIKHAQSQLDQGSLLETGGHEPSLVSGVKISSFFALMIRPYHSPGSPLLRELYALAQAIDLLRMGKLPETADALAARFVAVHTALTEGSWATAAHLELYPLEPVGSATTATMLEAHKHRRLVMKSQGVQPSGGWWGTPGKSKGSNFSKGKKGDGKGRGGRGKGKGSGKEQSWGAGKGENPWKENKDEPPKK